MTCSVNVLQKPCDGAEEGVTSCISLFHRRLLHQSHIIASLFHRVLPPSKNGDETLHSGNGGAVGISVVASVSLSLGRFLSQSHIVAATDRQTVHAAREEGHPESKRKLCTAGYRLVKKILHVRISLLSASH